MPEEVKDAQDQSKVADTSSDKKEVQKDDPLAKFDQKYGSWIGRLEAQQKKDRESILSKLDEINRNREQSPPNNPLQQGMEQPSGTDSLNNRWAEMILQGKVLEVLREHKELDAKATDTLSRRNVSERDRIVSALEEKEPIFKDIKKDVVQIADNLIGQGYSPPDAVAFAFERSQAAYYKKLAGVGGGGDIDPSSLETQTGGSRREDAGAKRGKLNAEGKRAFEKNKSHFKDEAEFISAMSPRVRERFVG